MSQNTQGKRYQPSSLYLDDDYYEWLTKVSADLNQAIVRDAVVPQEVQQEVTRLLTVEARLLDQDAHERWLELFAQQCIYWIPVSQPAIDPRNGITLEFHDRRRLLDRVTRLGTGLAYSQLPPSRLSRQISGVEIWPSPNRADDWHVRYSSLVSEFRVGKSQALAGWNGFVLRREEGALKIVVKQINLITGDQPLINNSFFM